MMKPVLLISLSLLLLLSGISAATASSVFGQEIVVAASTADEQLTDLAYNSLRQTLLVVWQIDNGDGDYDIWARRGRLQGSWQWLGNAFPVASSSTSERMAAVAYNSSDDDFLVVYEYQFSATDFDILGQRVAGAPGGGDNGGELKGGAFSIADTVGKEQNPDLIYFPASQHFLVVYELDGDIWAQRVARQHLGDSGGELIGQEFAVAADFEHEEVQPAVLVSTQQSYFLVSYAFAFADDDYDIRGQRVQGVLGAQNQLLGSAFDIAFSADSETRPAMGYSQNAQAFIVAWQASQAGNSDVRAIWLDERITEGNPAIGSPFAISADLVAQEKQPAVDVDPANGEVVVALSYAADEILLPRLGQVWLDPNPLAEHPLRRSLQLYPERPFAANQPLVEFVHGQPGMLLGFTASADGSESSEQDAYVVASSRWTTLMPLILR